MDIAGALFLYALFGIPSPHVEQVELLCISSAEGMFHLDTLRRKTICYNSEVYLN